MYSKSGERGSDDSQGWQTNSERSVTHLRISFEIRELLMKTGSMKLKEIESKTGTSLTILDDGWDDTGLEISGESQQRDMAEDLIKSLAAPSTTANNTRDVAKSSRDFVTDWQSHSKDSRSSSSYKNDFFESTHRERSRRDDNHLSKRDPSYNDSAYSFSVPSDVVGRIIGRGGAKIRELQEQTNTRIKVMKDCIDGSEIPIHIFGTEEQQKKAESLIKDLIDDDCRSSQTKNARTESQTDVAQIDWGAVIKESREATKRRWANSPAIRKDFYFEDNAVACMSSSAVENFRLTHNNISVSHYKQDDSRTLPNPVLSFVQAFSHYPEILEAVQSQNFKEPSPIQCQAWPVLLKGYDMIGIAQTGTGKTLAFLLPALIHIEHQPIPRSERKGPTVLVMAPTRELAQQIEREVAKFPYKGVKCACVYGGGDRRQQINVCAKGVEIVVATPGRLYDLMQAGALKTDSVSYVVLDEADRMLDLGFEPQIRKILIDVRPDRQTVMTSATWPEGVRRLANEYMDNPIQVCVGTLDLAAVHTVTQHVEIITEEEKREMLLAFIKSLESEDKAIIFVGRKLVADQVASDLSLLGISCQCIHGDRDQADREQALEDLRKGDVRLLIATDVASRGIDIKDITHILNYDFPRHAEEYVHRIGRTGRAGRSGVAVSFVTREDWSKTGDLIKILKEANQSVPRELERMAERFSEWKERKDDERRRNNADMGGGRTGGFGSRRGNSRFESGPRRGRSGWDN